MGKGNIKKSSASTHNSGEQVDNTKASQPDRFRARSYNANKYYAKFSCGHKGYISYFGHSDLMKKLAKVEKDGLCPECKRKELMENSVCVNMPYGLYKEKYAHRRNIASGAYNKDKRTIEVYMPQKLANEYYAESNRVWYDGKTLEINEGGYVVISLFIKGNAFPIKDKLKEIGFIWYDKHWNKKIVVFPAFEGSTKWLPPKDNPEFYSTVKQLEELGCIANFQCLDLDKTE